MVKVINIDPSGKIRLSRKALLQPEDGRRPVGSSEEGQQAPRREERRETAKKD
jgi:predicted RNA-binding protein with RPS1 domain